MAEMLRIKHNLTGAVLFEGRFNTMRLCVEAARASGVNLSVANLSGAYLSGANLSVANLSGAYLSVANLSGANLSGANLSVANLSGANLSGANLSGACLSVANLFGAYLSGANLSVANLSGAYLSVANLSGANLSGANLSGAILRDSITATGRPARIAHRSDGYTFYLWPTSAGWRVVAGCRFFTLDEAWLHWERTRAGTDLGDETLDILTMFELHVERSA